MSGSELAERQINVRLMVSPPPTAVTPMAKTQKTRPPPAESLQDVAIATATAKKATPTSSSRYSQKRKIAPAKKRAGTPMTSAQKRKIALAKKRAGTPLNPWEEKAAATVNRSNLKKIQVRRNENIIVCWRGVGR